MDWAQGNAVVEGGNFENEHYVKQLAGKTQKDTATEEDLELAKRTIQSHFVIGLMKEMGESMRRFNIVLGIDTEHGGKNARCMEKFFPKGGKSKEKSEKKKNSNPHPKVSTNDCHGYQLYQLLVSIVYGTPKN